MPKKQIREVIEKMEKEGKIKSLLKKSAFDGDTFSFQILVRIEGEAGANEIERDMSNILKQSGRFDVREITATKVFS